LNEIKKEECCEEMDWLIKEDLNTGGFSTCDQSNGGASIDKDEISISDGWSTHITIPLNRFCPFCGQDRRKKI